MARGNKRYKKICGRIYYISEDRESNKNTNRKANCEQSIRETMNIFDSRLYHKVTINSQEKCNLSSL